MPIRTFICISLDEAIREALREWQIHLKRKYGCLLRPVARKHMHLTLCFLGDVEEEAIPAISDGVGRAVADLDKFRMGVSSTGAFPHPSRARVLWAGVDEGRAAVEKVQEAVARALQRECGFQPDRRGFHSHVTVARVRRGEVLAAEEALADSCDTEWGHQWVGQVDLMKSDLRPGGPVHTVMDSLPLARLSSTC